MKTLKISFIITTFAVFSIACAQTAAPPKVENPSNAAVNQPKTDAENSSPELAAAKANYEKRCIRCHKENGAGGNVQIETTAIKVPNLLDPRSIAQSDEKYTKRIVNGGDGMPKFKDKLTDAEIAALVQYIRQEFQQK